MRNRTRIAFFLSAAVGILYIANLVVYEGVALALGLHAPLQRIALGITLGALPAGFIGTMILGSYYYNFFTRTLYTLLAVYMGAFAYLFFASVAYGIAVGIADLFGLFTLLEPLGWAFFAGAVLVSAYGVWHAAQIKAARYSVMLPNLPAQWKGKKALFISDLHLGQLHGPKFAAKVARAVNVQKPDIIFIGGDLYDGTQAPNPATLAEPLRALHAPWGTYYITGNHEEFGDNTVFINAVRSLGITILMDEKADLHGLQLLGVDYHNAHTVEGFTNILTKLSIDKTRPSLLLKHEPNHLSIAEEAGVSLQLSGHTHYGQQWPFGLVAQLNYIGYAYGLKPFGRMQMLTSSGIGTWGPPLRVGSNAEMAVITFS